jgi:hypothetical protein
MRLIPRNRNQHRQRKARIAISEAEISADLHYPAQARPPRPTTDARRLETR